MDTPSRRLSKLPVPVGGGFKKLCTTAKFTASPLVKVCTKLTLSSSEGCCHEGEEGESRCESPAKLPRCMASPDHPSGGNSNPTGRLSFAPRNSLLATPPQRLPRKSLAPNPYGIQQGTFLCDGDSFASCRESAEEQVRSGPWGRGKDSGLR